MTQDVENIPAIALQWHRAGNQAALATVVRTWGSAPRPVGAQLAISQDGSIMGSVSGGCVEGAVVAEALDAFDDGLPRMLTYGVSDDAAFAVGLACGGEIQILVEPVGQAIPEDMLASLVARRADNEPVAYTVDIETWERRLEGPDAFPTRFAADKSGFDDSLFVTIHNPPLRLAVVGGVHIAQHLLPIAKACGFEAVLIDPREAFASVARFPESRLIHDWPDDALSDFAPDARSAIVTLTHDAKLDDPALQIALRSDAFYIGCLGSTRTHAKRLERLQDAGFDAQMLARLDAPVGLDIGAKSPAEIGVAIMAGIIRALRST